MATLMAASDHALARLDFLRRQRELDRQLGTLPGLVTYYDQHESMLRDQLRRLRRRMKAEAASAAGVATHLAGKRGGSGSPGASPRR